MGKRIFLFLLTNVVVMATLSIVVSVLGLDRYLYRQGLDLVSLAGFCLVWGMGGAFLSLQMSRWLAKQATGTRLVDGHTGDIHLDRLYQSVERLARQANLPMPEVGVYESPEVNAFATGPSKSRSLVAVSSGLLHSMRPDEIDGVLAHEIAHIANGDMVTMTLLQGVLNAFVMFAARVIAHLLTRGSRDERENSSYMVTFAVRIALEIGLSIIASFITAWFSRRREFRADRGGAELAGRERMLAALRRLAANQALIDPQHEALATLKISGARGWMALRSTHPPLEQRIAALEAAQF